MPLLITRDIEEFTSLAADFLAARIERNVLATVLAAVGSGLYGSEPPLFALRRDDGTGEPASAAIRTPPWAMLADGFEHPGSAEELIDRWLELDPELSGVSAQPDTARAIAAAWASCTGGSTELQFTEAMHELSTVIPPARLASGALRRAREADRETLIEWERAFVAEAGTGNADQAPRAVDRRLALGRQTVWEDGGEPVSTVAFNANIAGVQRIGPVYTPPARRGRGYATAAVAAVSRQLLDGGARQCMLFTDLANPTSNKIYASIGYVRFADWEEYRFSPPA